MRFSGQRLARIVNAELFAKRAFDVKEHLKKYNVEREEEPKYGKVQDVQRSVWYKVLNRLSVCKQYS